MANPFDQFDAPASNAFDRFDMPEQEAQSAREAAAKRLRGPLANRPVDYERHAPTSSWSDMLALGQRGINAANKDLAATVGRPIDALIDVGTGNASFTTGKYHPVENWMNRTFTHNDKPPETPLDMVADAAGKMFGETVPMMGATSLLAQGPRFVATEAPTITSALKSVYNRAMDYAARHPVGTLGGETVASNESGAVGELLRQHADAQGYGPTAQHFAETVGQVGGPAAIQMLPGALAIRFGGSAIRRGADVARDAVSRAAAAVPEAQRPSWLNDLATSGAAREAHIADKGVRRELGGILAEPQNQAGIAEAQRLEGDIPGFRPGLARATGDQRLINKQEQLNREATGADLRAAQGAQQANEEALRTRLDNVAPAPGGEPQDIAQGAARERVSNLQGRIADQQTQTTNQLRAATDTLPDAERGGQGARLREIHDQLERESNAEVTRLRAAIDPGNRTRVSTAALSDAVRARLRDQGTSLTGAQIPSRVRTLMQRASARAPRVEEETAVAGVSEPQVVPGQTVAPRDRNHSINSVLNARTAILQDLRRLNSASSLSPEQIRSRDALNASLDEVNRFVNNLEVPNAGVQARFNQFRDYYRDTHVPNFREGASRDIGRYDQFGYDKNRVPDEKVMAQFGGPNNISAAQQFTRVFGNNPEAVQMMADHQLGRLKAEGVNPTTGLLREDAVPRFLAKNHEMLDALPPQVREAVSARDVGDLYGRLGQLEQRQRAVAGSTVARALGGTPERTLDAALNDWQLMRGLRRSVGGNAAGARIGPPTAEEAALQRAVMARAPDPTDATKFRAWLEGHDRVLRQVMSPEHINDLRTIAQGAEMHGRVAAPQGAVDLPRSIAGMIGDKTGVTVPSAVGSGLSIARGRTSPMTEIPMQLVKAWNRQQEQASQTAWREALSNPDLARTLAAVSTAPRATPQQTARIHHYMLTSGVLGPSNVEENEQP